MVSLLGRFLAFLMVLGWEGPVVVMLGVRDWGWGTIAAGAFLTAFFWGVLGFPLLTQCAQHLSEHFRPEKHN